jgi:hypothetical protein
MRANLLTRLAVLEAVHAPRVAPAFVFPDPPGAWWAEFLTVCRTLPEGADVLGALGLAADDIHALLAQEDHP